MRISVTLNECVFPAQPATTGYPQYQPQAGYHQQQPNYVAMPPSFRHDPYAVGMSNGNTSNLPTPNIQLKQQQKSVPSTAMDCGHSYASVASDEDIMGCSSYGSSIAQDDAPRTTSPGSSIGESMPTSSPSRSPSVSVVGRPTANNTNSPNADQLTKLKTHHKAWIQTTKYTTKTGPCATPAKPAAVPAPSFLKRTA